jgi:hypothetical protein
MINNKEPMNNQITRLKTAIARCRQRLQSLWDAKGYTDSEVLNAGIELDLLLKDK